MNVKKTIKFYLYIFFISKIFSEENNIIYKNIAMGGKKIRLMGTDAN